MRSEEASTQPVAEASEGVSMQPGGGESDESDDSPLLVTRSSKRSGKRKNDPRSDEDPSPQQGAQCPSVPAHVHGVDENQATTEHTEEAAEIEVSDHAVQQEPVHMATAEEKSSSQDAAEQTPQPTTPQVMEQQPRTDRDVLVAPPASLSSTTPSHHDRDTDSQSHCHTPVQPSTPVKEFVTSLSGEQTPQQLQTPARGQDSSPGSSGASSSVHSTPTAVGSSSVGWSTPRGLTATCEVVDVSSQNLSEDVETADGW